MALTYDEFLKTVPRPVVRRLSPVERLNAAMVACRRLSGLDRMARARVDRLRQQLMLLAAAGGSPEERLLDSIVADLKALGLQVLDQDSVHGADGSAEGLPESTLRDMYRDYLDAQLMFKREERQAIRHANQS